MANALSRLVSGCHGTCYCFDSLSYCDSENKCMFMVFMHVLRYNFNCIHLDTQFYGGASVKNFC